MGQAITTPGTLSGRRQRKRLETRERIFTTALRLFLDKGYQATTIDEITEVSDVAKGTFFNYFATKEHVLLAFAELQLSKIESARQQVMVGGNVYTVLRQMVRNIYAEPSHSRAFTQSLISLGLTNHEIGNVMGKTLTKGRGILTLILDEGRRTGELRDDLNSEITAAVIQRTMFGTLTAWAISGQGKLMEMIDQNLDCLWNGISRQSAPRN